MKRGLDTNVLVYAHIAALADHPAVRTYLLGQLQRPDVIIVLTAGVLHEFLHVITDGRRFDPPVTMAEGIALVRLYLGRTNIECVTADEAALRLALDLLERHQLGRRRIADTLLTATLLSNGVTELVTCNPDDFRVFEGLTVIDPRAA